MGSLRKCTQHHVDKNATDSSTVPWFWFLLLDNRVLVHGFQGVVCAFFILVLIRFHTILVPNQVEPKALVLETQLTRVQTAQNFWYQNAIVVALWLFSVLAQH